MNIYPKTIIVYIKHYCHTLQQNIIIEVYYYVHTMCFTLTNKLINYSLNNKKKNVICLKYKIITINDNTYYILYYCFFPICYRLRYFDFSCHFVDRRCSV